MYFKDGTLKLSPSDLTQFMRSPFAFHKDLKTAEFLTSKALCNKDDAMSQSLRGEATSTKRRNGFQRALRY